MANVRLVPESKAEPARALRDAAHLTKASDDPGMGSEDAVDGRHIAQPLARRPADLAIDIEVGARGGVTKRHRPRPAALSSGRSLGRPARCP